MKMILNRKSNQKQDNEFRASFHNNSKFSGDDYLRGCTLERMIKRAFKDRLDLLAVTDNSNDVAFDYLKDNYKYFSGLGYKINDLGGNVLVIESNVGSLYFIRGIEFHRNSKKIGGHLLAIGHNKKIEDFDKYSAKDLINIVHDYGGLAIPAHPFATISYGINIGGMGEKDLVNIKDDIDAIEVFNAQNIGLLPFVFDLRRFNKKAREFANKYNLARICSTDSHRAEDVSVCYMRFPKDKIDFSNGQKFIESLKYLISLTKDEDTYKKFAYERYNSRVGFIEWAVIPKLV